MLVEKNCTDDKMKLVVATHAILNDTLIFQEDLLSQTTEFLEFQVLPA